jgi:hypothetical protein
MALVGQAHFHPVPLRSSSTVAEVAENKQIAVKKSAREYSSCDVIIPIVILFHMLLTS